MQDNINISNIEVKYKEKSKFYEWGVHSHNGLEIYYIDKGKVIVHLDDKNFKAQQGDLFLFGEGQFHSMEGNLKEPPNIINISFEIPDDENISMLISVIKNRKIKISLDVHSILKDLLIEAKFKKTGNQFMLKAKLIELLIKLARHTRENRHPEFLPVLTHENWNNDLISKIKKYLDKNFYKNLSSSDLNKKFGVSLGHLCRVFKKQTSVTISQYLNNLKMNEAKYLLRKSSLNVSQIAEKLGYPNIHYFSNSFKKKFALSPTEYSRSLNTK